MNTRTTIAIAVVAVLAAFAAFASVDASARSTADRPSLIGLGSK